MTIVKVSIKGDGVRKPAVANFGPHPVNFSGLEGQTGDIPPGEYAFTWRVKGAASTKYKIIFTDVTPAELRDLVVGPGTEGGGLATVNVK